MLGGAPTGRVGCRPGFLAVLCPFARKRFVKPAGGRAWACWLSLAASTRCWATVVDFSPGRVLWVGRLVLNHQLVAQRSPSGAGDRLGENISVETDVDMPSEQVVDVLVGRYGVQRGLIEVREWIPMLFCDSPRARQPPREYVGAALSLHPRGRGTRARPHWVLVNGFGMGAPG